MNAENFCTDVLGAGLSVTHGSVGLTEGVGVDSKDNASNSNYGMADEQSSWGIREGQLLTHEVNSAWPA